VLFILAAAAILINAALTRAQDPLIAFGVILVGVPIYAMWRRRSPGGAGANR
jgi:hypothetical protein